jgi:hypothetical protein
VRPVRASPPAVWPQLCSRSVRHISRLLPKSFSITATSDCGTRSEPVGWQVCWFGVQEFIVVSIRFWPPGGASLQSCSSIVQDYRSRLRPASASCISSPCSHTPHGGKAMEQAERCSAQEQPNRARLEASSLPFSARSHGSATAASSSSLSTLNSMPVWLIWCAQDRDKVNRALL